MIDELRKYQHELLLLTQDKDIDMLKYQMRMNTKKFSLDMENLRWELTSNRRFDESSGSSSGSGIGVTELADMGANEKEMRDRMNNH